MGFVGSVEDWAIYGELVMDGEENNSRVGLLGKFRDRDYFLFHGRNTQSIRQG